MATYTCPYLGLKDDPDTPLQFPAEDNHCHHARPVAPVRLSYQQTTCLTENYRACPVYVRAGLSPLPGQIAAPRARSPRPFGWVTGRRLAVGAGALAALLVLALLVSGAAGTVLSWFGLPDNLPVTGGGGGVVNTPFQPADRLSPTPLPLEMLLALTSSPDPTLSACPMPDGWTLYQVNPTDSLMLLSMAYNVPVEMLQQVNCMGDRRLLTPGDLIYVPAVATPTSPVMAGGPPQVPITPVTLVPQSPFRPAATASPSTTASQPPDDTNTARPSVTGTLTLTITPNDTLPAATVFPGQTLTASLTVSVTAGTGTPLVTLTPSLSPPPGRTPTASRTPTPSRTPSPTLTPTPSQTPPVSPTGPTPTWTVTPSPTLPEPTSTWTVTPSPTLTQAPSSTFTPSATSTPEPSFTPSATSTPEPTFTEANTAAPSPTETLMAATTLPPATTEPPEPDDPTPPVETEPPEPTLTDTPMPVETETPEPTVTEPPESTETSLPDPTETDPAETAPPPDLTATEPA